jgi:hypothetical protein
LDGRTGVTEQGYGWKGVREMKKNKKSKAEKETAFPVTTFVVRLADGTTCEFCADDVHIEEQGDGFLTLRFTRLFKSVGVFARESIVGYWDKSSVTSW